jgi:hypothetical protein
VAGVVVSAQIDGHSIGFESGLGIAPSRLPRYRLAYDGDVLTGEQVDFFTHDSLEEAGFRGFVPLHALDVTTVPSLPGVYVVVRESEAPVTFLDENPGGRFKASNPTVAIPRLTEKWVDGCCVLYIGKATNLRSRLRQYRDFGRGKPIGHWGGRYIWQLADAHELLVCWKPTTDSPRDLERRLLTLFCDSYGTLPFANLMR